MMKYFEACSIALAAGLLFATSSSALEKRAAPAIDRIDDWNAGADCYVAYYNICTGWVWIWSGFADEDRLGTVFNTCTSPGDAALMFTSIFVVSGVPPGYGYTGTIGVHSFDANNCPVGAAIASQPFVPMSQGQVVNWSGVTVPGDFALVVTLATPLGGLTPVTFGTDHPAAGPTGPQPCGLCYPSTRENHSFMYGSVASPICPGSVFNDGVCDAQLFWDASVVFIDVGVESASWGSIKGLYR